MARVNQLDFGGDVQPTAQQVQRMQLAQQLMQQGGSTAPVYSPLEGIARAGQGLIGGLMQRRENESIQQRQDARSRDLAAIVAGGNAEPWRDPDTGQQVGTAGGLAGMLATSDRLELPESRDMLMRMQLAKALQGAPERRFENVPGVGLVEIPPTGDPRVAIQKPEEKDLGAMIIAGPDGQPMVNPLWVQAKQAIRPEPTRVSQVVGGDEFGKPPPGWRMYKDESGRVQMEPIPGGPADAEASADAEKARARQENRARAGGTVIQDLNRALGLVEDSPKSTTGVGGLLLRGLPETNAKTVQGHIDSALSNVGLDTLQAMREASPTGGALGQVPIQQQQRLEQVLGSLDITQRTDVVEDNLKRVSNIYMDIVHGTPEQIQQLVDEGKMDPRRAAEVSKRHKLSFDEFGRPAKQAEQQVEDAKVLDGVRYEKRGGQWYRAK